ncbi:hypothetical protein [Actinomadura terrae]|uniref:hypothetical protein n=1 Tax=Actinomadura terrae TaxID=604353 RepID=UPI001FA75297|nr:hypothetical protein [Actinomadura terrae]
MRTCWQCYSWHGAEIDVAGAPDEEWTSPEGAVEFLRTQLTTHGLYSKEVLVEALRDLRSGGSVSLGNDLPDGDRLHLAVRPVQAGE